MADGMQLKFEIAGEKQVSRFFDVAVDSISDFSPVYSKIADEFRETQDKVFNAEGSFEGRARWAPLTKGYKNWKDANFPGKPILTLTGDLRRSFVKGGKNHVYDVTEKELSVGSKDPKAMFHQLGTKLAPQRKIVEITEPQKTRWVKIVHTSIWDSLSAAAKQAMQSGNVAGRR